MTSSRGARSRDQSVVFSTSTTTFTSAGPSARSALIRTRPSTASRRRTTRPTTRPLGRRCRTVSMSLAGGEPERCCSRRRDRATTAARERCRRRARPPRPTARTPCRRRRAGRSRRIATVGHGALDGAVLHLEAADAHGERRRRARVDDALGAHRPPLGAVDRAARAGHEHAELPAQLVLASPTRGTGTARTPRRAPRRRQPVRPSNRSAVG